MILKRLCSGCRKYFGSNNSRKTCEICRDKKLIRKDEDMIYSRNYYSKNKMKFKNYYLKKTKTNNFFLLLEQLD